MVIENSKAATTTTPFLKLCFASTSWPGDAMGWDGFGLRAHAHWPCGGGLGSESKVNSVVGWGPV